MSQIRWFQTLSRHDVELAGGKGANLGEMTQAGLPIPPGFVVTAEAYRTFLEEAGLPERMARELDGLDVEDTDMLNAEAATLQERILAAPGASNEEEMSGWTDIFIYPGFDFKVTDAMVTNFHLPRSTLLMLVAAFAGREKILAAYRTAVSGQRREPQTPPLWDGKAAGRIVRIIQQTMKSSGSCESVA